MNKKDTDKIIDALTPIIEESIKKTVNGKIDRLSADFVLHSEEMKPIIDGWKTIKGVRSFVIWVAGLFLSIGAIMTFIKGL